ncbi:hypothetical protein A3G55_04555 [Candidatus Giovannonibacteria bacterium RIFCSPLOWO2_12_FULL_44_25]|uniref:methionine--tRNA ligase n=3 Tax=Parcubacteria group TaxID=1794811 RepID=A0A837IKN5_9BACT|nr:MAG: Methionine-tRNA ligase [Candidatus Giovannonibacteria bacterium GW2011_GWA1_44_25]KKU12084.1 MAG: Methionine-tRNA ligase [Candidatus Azambacteria bacterium GW2011_GWC2_45_7b]KKU29858.1 MAG: Methionine-tRNA ligase [Candidatus Giovannonibacteria bacterium GW2011_GWB1_46_20]OGF48924.1 MAG: hypothetical protein A2120_04965 [Candidatus Giovannonibacteria bacterium GWA2_45_15]OGF59701.1 MAG: hypothetical protein A2W40_01280 [Candidatus Giovannonibacteria bacterium RIFCSPHIGHO2_01_45_12]OGF60
MKTEKDKFYITTSIPYLNAPPHLGFALEALQADVVARHSRLRDKDVFFLSGTDEHGAKIARAAGEAQKTPKEFVDGLAVVFQDLLKKLNISNDDFIRTSDKERHWPGAQLLWKKLAEAGDIYKSFYKGLYCVGHEAFITEKDMEGNVCAIHKKPPEAIEEENYFFKLSKYTNRLLEAISKEDMKILPSFRKEETLNMLKEIGDVSFSRPSKDIAWGVPVPSDATQTMYVWCDALANYITALGYGESFGSPTSTGNRTSKFERFWPADIHVVGKDIMKFHTIFWPAMLMSAGLSLPKIIFVHGWVNVKGEKMSKSLGNVIDPIPLIEKYGSEAVRFYLAHETSVFGDSDYSDKHFSEIYSGLLVNGLGNLLARTLKMISLYPAISKPEEGALARYPIKKNLEFLTTGEKKRWSFEQASPSFLVDNVLWLAYQKAMAAYEISQAIKNIWIYLGRLDEYIEDYKLYKMVKSQPEEAKVVLWHLAYSLASVAWMIKPFMPETADKILLSLGVEPTSREEWKEFSAKEFAHLFPRIQ